MTEERYGALLREYILKTCRGMTREPGGVLKYPYLVPSAPDSPLYSATLWDWDSWLTGVALGQAELELDEPGAFFEYEAGCVRNFLDMQEPDGGMPICVDANNSPLKSLRPGKSNIHKPVLAQHAAAVSQRAGAEWVRPHLQGLEAFADCYLTEYMHPETGLTFWQDDFAVGVDNDPSVFFRPPRSCGSIYLNSLLYRELLALGWLSERLGEMKRATRWRNRAQDLADAVNRWCWDERDGTYYSVDFALEPVQPDAWLHSGAPRSWPCLLLRIDSWSSFMPLWAGIASREQAERARERLRDRRTFNAPFGVRTLSRLEKMYSLRASNNPSNWLGPVWGVSNFMVFSGLLRYGFEEDARDLAEKTVGLFGRDLEKNGCLHEYYNPDTGEPVMTHGFQNWNFLALNMLAWLEGRRFVDTF